MQPDSRAIKYRKAAEQGDRYARLALNKLRVSYKLQS